MTKDERTEFGPVKVPYTLLYPKTSERSREGGLTGKEIPNILVSYPKTSQDPNINNRMIH